MGPYGAPKQKFIRIALAVIFFHKDLSSWVVKKGQARANLEVIEQASRTATSKIFDHGLRKFVASILSLLQDFFLKISFAKAIILPVLS